MRAAAYVFQITETEEKGNQRHVMMYAVIQNVGMISLSLPVMDHQEIHRRW